MLAWVLYSIGAVVALYALVVVALVALGRRDAARAVASFVPDCIVLFTRLLRHPEVPRSSKILLAAVVPYLASPIDLVPDFIPVAGQLDDAVLVAYVLRRVLRKNDRLVCELWPGPESSLNVILRLAGREGLRAAT